MKGNHDVKAEAREATEKAGPTEQVPQLDAPNPQDGNSPDSPERALPSESPPSDLGDPVAELEMLLSILPQRLREAIARMGPELGLIEIVMDLGRMPEVRTHDRSEVFEAIEIDAADLQHVVEHIGHFGEDNRAGIARTLHRISAIRNRKGQIIGLTLRVGRAVFGTVEIVRDIVESGRSMLLLGAPGVGKTTMLRETARLLAQSRRVVIVDTSNEIAGDGDIPHPAIGRARRMQVTTPVLQHEVMIEAVENHNPEVIVIDEIGRELEALAARTIAERGVQLVGTAHGRSLENLLLNPTLSDLVGGIESVTLSDEEARRRGTQKTVLERRSPPTFEVVIEIQGWQSLVVHHDTATAIDALLRRHTLRPELRYKDESGATIVERGDLTPAESDGRHEPGKTPSRSLEGNAQGLGSILRGPRGKLDAVEDRAERRASQAQGPRSGERGPDPKGSAGEGDPARVTAVPRHRAIRILAYGVSHNRLRRSSKALGVPVILVENLDEADSLVTLKSYYRKRPAVISEAEGLRKPVYVLRSNTYAQIENALIDMFGVHSRDDSHDRAMDEAREAIRSIVNGSRNMVELNPQAPGVRRQQHELVRESDLRSLSRGIDPQRRVRIYRD
jgi:stage III sporulation protein SpoIIIAA